MVIAPRESAEHKAFVQALTSEGGFSNHRIRNFLWLLNAHPRLISFLHVCMNLAGSLKCLGEQGIDLRDFEIQDWPVITSWVKSNPSILRKSLPEDFFQLPAPDAPHPIIRRGLCRHGIYGLLCNTHELSDYRDRYSLLVGHILLAHIESMKAFVSLDSYETYDGSAEILTQYRPIYHAALAMRELSVINNFDVFKDIAHPRARQDFLNFFNSLDPADYGTFRVHINNLRTYLLDRTTDKRKRSRRGHSQKKRGGERKLEVEHGYVGLSSEYYLDEGLTDPDDPYCDWGKQEVLTDMVQPENLSPEAIESVHQGASIEELGGGEEIILSDYGCKTSKKGLAGLIYSARAQARHRSMAIQFLPWTYNRLTTSEYSEILLHLEEWFWKLYKLPSLTREEEIQAEAIVIALISFWTGCPFAVVYETEIINKNQLSTCTLGIYLRFVTESETTFYNEWRIRTITIDHYADADDNPLSRKRDKYTWMPDLVGFTKFLRAYLKKLDLKQKKYSLFRYSLKEQKNALLHILKTSSFYQRITAHKIENFMFTRLFDHCGDVSVAASITGKEVIINSVRSHYFAPSVNFLISIYKETVAGIVEELNQARCAWRKLQEASQELDNDLQGYHVGSLVCPRFEAVANAIQDMKAALAAPPPLEDMTAAWNYHNVYTLYSILAFGFATACRAIIEPLLPSTAIDPESGFAVLADKEDVHKSKSRPLWVPPFVHQQLASYEKHCRRIIRLKIPSDAEKAKGALCFFLDEQGVAEVARPLKIALYAKPFLPFPANAHRHFIRTELIERRCPAEVVDGWMGHWFNGESPWSKYSSLSYATYVAALQKHLLPLLMELGFEHLPSTLGLKHGQ